MSDYFDFEKSIAEMEKMIEKLKSISPDKNHYNDEIAEIERKCLRQKQELYGNLTPWQTVQIARHPKRPVLQDYISLVFSDFIELHGDRTFGDDQALIGGFATIGECRVMLIGHNKGKNVDENVIRNFGQAKPEGYRKALRLMKLAERYDLPVLCFIDTQGAYPGIEAEERGQPEAIATNLTEMARIEIPDHRAYHGRGRQRRRTCHRRGRFGAYAVARRVFGDFSGRLRVNFVARCIVFAAGGRSSQAYCAVAACA